MFCNLCSLPIDAPLCDPCIDDARHLVAAYDDRHVIDNGEPEIDELREWLDKVREMREQALA